MPLTLRRADLFADLALAVFLVAMTALSVDEERRPDAVAYALCAVAGLVFALWRRAPSAVFAVALLGCVVAYVALGYAGGPIYRVAPSAELQIAARSQSWL